MNKFIKLCFCLLALAISLPGYTETLELTGRELTIDKLWRASEPGHDVKVSAEGWRRIEAAYRVSIQATQVGIEVYGLTTNVGDLKDQSVVEGDIESEPNRSKSIAFNKRQFRIQAAGLEPYLDNRLVKMSMIIRLNQMAAGLTGMTVEAAKAYQTFINNDIYPLIPSRGSMGVNDLAWPTHIGLAMIGEWEVVYRGKRQPSAQVMKAVRMKPLEPFGLDGISIISNGNVSMALTIDALKRVKHQLELSPYLIAAGLETLNGNISPFLWHSVEGKAMPKGHEAAEGILKALKGSYLWQLHPQRYLQDPLSFRSAHWTLAAALEELEQLERLVELQINHTSDNPLVTIDGRTDLWYSGLPAVRALMVDKKPADKSAGSFVNSNSAFDFTQIAIQVESLTRTMAHVLHNAAWRILQVGDADRTQLQKYLVSKRNVGGDGFANIAQPISGLYAEAMGLSNNVTLYGLPTSIGIEETYNNVNVTADRLRRMAEIGYEIFSFELLHMAQGAQIRRDEQGLALGQGTQKLLEKYRRVVPFVDEDRAFTGDVNNGVAFLKQLSAAELD